MACSGRLDKAGWTAIERDQIACKVSGSPRCRELTSRQDEVPVLDMDQVLEMRGFFVAENEI